MKNKTYISSEIEVDNITDSFIKDLTEFIKNNHGKIFVQEIQTQEIEEFVIYNTLEKCYLEFMSEDIPFLSDDITDAQIFYSYLDAKKFKNDNLDDSYKIIEYI